MESRIKNSTRNTLFASINFMVKLILQFVVRTIFLRYLSNEYLGINSLFTNILQILSLAELGIGQAIVYSMYKPVAENDTEKIKSLVKLYRNIYYVVGVIIIVVGLSITPFLEHLIAEKPNVDVNLYIVFLIYLFNTAFGYFFAHRRSLIFAYQRNDIETKVHFCTSILLNLLQIAALVLFKSYYAYVVLLPLTTVLDAVIVFYISFRMFPAIKGKAKIPDKSETDIIKKNTFAMVFHKIGGVVVFGTSNIVISKFIGLEVLGLYSNYLFVITAISSLIGLFTASVTSSIGNLIAKESTDSTYDMFKKLNFIQFLIVGTFSVCLFVLFQHFIATWIGAENRLGFVIVILICLNFYITNMRTVTNSFKIAAGLFTKDWFKPIVESVINLAAALTLVNFIGLSGVILATIISTIAMPLWIEPLVLFKYQFKKNALKYFVWLLFFSVLTVGIAAFAYFVCSFMPSSGWLWFILKGISCVIIAAVIYLAVFFKRAELKYLLALPKKILKN